MKLLVFPYEQWRGKITGSKHRVVSLAKKFRGAKGMDVRAPPTNVEPIKFNPSITLLRKKSKSCVYAVAYRAHFPAKKGYKGHPAPRLPTPRTDTAKGRVGIWDFGFRNYWDGTGICEIEVFDDRIVIRKDAIPMKGGMLLDPRIVRHDADSSLFLQYSDYAFGQDKWDVPLTPALKRCGEHWDDLCIMIGTVPIKLDSKEGFTIQGKGGLICQNESQMFEKNWAYVPDGRKTKTFQYSCGPLKYVRGVQSGGTDTKVCISLQKQSTFFSRLYAHLGDVVPGTSGNGIACTSPLQKFGTSSYIGLGHIKLLYKKFRPQSKKNAHRFIAELAERQGLNPQKPAQWFKDGINMHKTYIYVMFLYTVNRKTLELERVSDAFLPQSDRLPYFSTLVFPMAIQPFLGSNYALSLGMSDHDGALLLMSKKEITDSLRLSASAPADSMRFKIVQC